MPTCRCALVCALIATLAADVHATSLYDYAPSSRAVPRKASFNSSPPDLAEEEADDAPDASTIYSDDPNETSSTDSDETDFQPSLSQQYQAARGIPSSPPRGYYAPAGPCGPNGCNASAAPCGPGGCGVSGGPCGPGGCPGVVSGWPTSPFAPTADCRRGSDALCGWYASADALFLHRNNGNATMPLAVTTGGGAVLTTDSLSAFNWAVGPRILLGYGWTQQRAFEVSYFGLVDSQASAFVNGNHDVSLPGALGLASSDFLNANRIGATYTSRLNNAEFNVLHNHRAFSWLAGFRFLRLDERLDINARAANADSSDYTIFTRNNLIGAQLGGRFRKSHGRFYAEATAKAGVYGNLMQQSQFVGDLNNTVTLRNTLSRASDTSFVGDINLSAAFQINKVWALRGGYNVLFLENMVLAPSQLDYSHNGTSGWTLHEGGNLFYQGVNAGLEAHW